jgi:hypothetical protein
MITAVRLPVSALAVLVIAGASLGAQRAVAQDALSAARAAYAAVDYEACRAESARALKQPGDRAARAETYKLEGLCRAALGDTDGARDAFKAMLAIDKDARLPDGLSPRFTSSYREAKGALVDRTPLSLAVESDTDDGGTRTLVVALTDELKLVKELAWRGEGGELSPATRAAPRLELEVPANVAVTLVALDVGAGEVLELGVGKPGDARVADAAPAAAEEDDGGFPWLLVGGIAAGVVVLAGAGVVAAVLLTPPDSVTLKTDVAFQD